MSQRILIVGGVAGGASTAARARRLCESCEIVVFDRGPYVSFANCGLPYHVGDVIPDERDLLVATPQLFKERFDIEVRTHTEVLSIDREAQTLSVRDLRSEETRIERYDKLVLSPGASAIRPPLPGIDLPGLFVVRTIPDSREIRQWISERSAKRAVVIGGGFIGLEMAENLHARGLEVSIVEMANQVLPPLDAEMAAPVQEELTSRDVKLILGDGVASFSQRDDGLLVTTAGGRELEADLVILAIGVRPNTELAKSAGLEIGERGGIVVDASMRTSDEKIFAVGDAVEVRDVVTRSQLLLALAGPANRQGRIAADALFGRTSEFRGVQGTAVCGIFDLTVAATGASEKSLQRAGITDYEAIYLHPGNHVSYYPGARPIHLKLLVAKPDGRILGAQAVGERDVARRIDVIAMALQMGGTADDLAESELCYAPQFGAAKDPVNLAGMIAQNVLRGDLPARSWGDPIPDDALLLDVSNEDEFNVEHVPGAVNIPLPQLRKRLDEVPVDRDVLVYCNAGQRAYYATRVLMHRGCRVFNLLGGIQTWRAFQESKKAE